MAQSAIPDRNGEQLSVGKILLLSLLPGAMAVIFDLLVAPIVARLSTPPLLTRFLGNALFIALFELGFLYLRGKRISGRYSLKDIVLYREPLPWWLYVVLVAVLLAWGFGVGGLLGPLSVALRDRLFSWMPAVFTAEPASLDPGLYPRAALVVTVVLGIVFTGIVIPVAEEIYYRGFLLPRMSWLGWLAPAINVALWGLNHFFEPWNIPLFILIFLPVAYVVWWKKNIYVSVAAHLLANLMATLPMLAWLAGGGS